MTEQRWKRSVWTDTDTRYLFLGSLYLQIRCCKNGKYQILAWDDVREKASINRRLSGVTLEEAASILLKEVRDLLRVRLTRLDQLIQSPVIFE